MRESGGSFVRPFDESCRALVAAGLMERVLRMAIPEEGPATALRSGLERSGSEMKSDGPVEE